MCSPSVVPAPLVGKSISVNTYLQHARCGWCDLAQAEDREAHCADLGIEMPCDCWSDGVSAFTRPCNGDISPAPYLAAALAECSWETSVRHFRGLQHSIV